jgi:hypothetical protein
MRKTHIIVLMVIFGLALTFRGHAQAVDYDNVPDDIRSVVAQAPFAAKYAVIASINPFYLRGDFDGDGKADYAFRIKATKDGQLGIAVWLSGIRQIVVMGADIPFKAGGATTTNLDFIDYWHVYGRKPIEQGVEEGPAPKLLGEAILVGKKESASGLIYWNGKRFVWYQQGD